MKNYLNKYESFIKLKAKRYANREADIEDFEQVGRIAVWKSYGKADPIIGPDNYVKRSIENAMRNHATHLYRTKKNEPFRLDLPDNAYQELYGESRIL